MKKNIIIVLVFMLILSFNLDDTLAKSQDDGGWWFPYIGRYNGEWEASIGVHFWNDYIKLRNLQLRGSMDLAPGLRTNMVLRSNKKFDSINSWNPNFDELYLESYGFHYGEFGKLSTSLKIGKMRYLRFPYPDFISTFDQVPGTEDLRFDDAETGYNGEMLTLDYASKYGFGYHLTGINWDFGKRDGSNLIENYLFYKDQWGVVDVETRVGDLQLRHPGGPVKRGGRPYHLGRSGKGYSLYLGSSWLGYKLGFLYENLYDDKFDERDIRTGVMVTFDFSKVTEILGKLRFDYTRSPEGFVSHLPLFRGELGSIRNEKPKNVVLVGEIKAERVITYWQNGQGRNFYEHRVSSWGETGKEDSILVVEKEPWYLRLEALVSPHTSLRTWDDLVAWENDRQGPAQLCQKVIYKFYEKKLKN